MSRSSQQVQSSVNRTHIVVSRTITTSSQLSRQKSTITSAYETPSLTTQKRQHKKGLTTTSISPSTMQQQPPHSTQPLYTQYIHTLQTQITSRQKQRIQLNKNLQFLSGQNHKLFNQVQQQGRKLAIQSNSILHLQSVLKDLQAKNRSVLSEKDRILQQLHYNEQRNRTLEANEMKLRTHLEHFQHQLNQKSADFTEKTKHFAEKNHQLKKLIEKRQQELAQCRKEKQELRNQLRSNQITSQKVIDQLSVEKQYVQRQYENCSREFNQAQILVKQKQSNLRILNSKLVQIEKAKNHQISNLTQTITQLTLSMQTLEHELQASHLTVTQQAHEYQQKLTQLKVQMRKLQHDNSSKSSQINHLSHSIQSLQTTLKHQEITLQNLEQSIKKQTQTHNQNNHLNQQKLQILQNIISTKQHQYQQLTRELHNAKEELSVINSYCEKQKNQFEQQIEKMKQTFAVRLEEQCKNSMASRQLLKSMGESLKLQASERQRQLITAFDQARKQWQETQDRLRKDWAEDKLNNEDKWHRQLAMLRNEHQRKELHWAKELEEEKSKAQAKLIHFIKDSQTKFKALQSTMQFQLQQNSVQLQQKQRQIQQKTTQIYSFQQTIFNLSQKQQQSLTKLQHLQNQLQLNQHDYQTKIIQIQANHQHQLLSIEQQHNLERHQYQQEMHIMKTQAETMKQQFDLKISNVMETIKKITEEKKRLEDCLKTMQGATLSKEDQWDRQFRSMQEMKELELMAIRQDSERQIRQVTIQFNERYSELSREKQDVERQYNELVELTTKASEQCQSIIQTHTNTLIPLHYPSTHTSQPYNSHYLLAIPHYLNNAYHHIFSLKHQLSETQNSVQQQKKEMTAVSAELHEERSLRFEVQKKLESANGKLLELQKKLRQKKNQEDSTIEKMKQHILKYKQQLSIYEKDLQRIGEQVEKYQLQTRNKQLTISLLQQQLTDLKKSQLLSKSSFTQQISQLTTQNNQKLQLLINQHSQSLALLKQQHQRKLQQSQTMIQSLQRQSTKLSKLLCGKDKQLEELERHYELKLERQKAQLQNKISAYQKELEYSNLKINLNSNSVANSKVSLLEEIISKKDHELKLLEQNNALLRKNLINSINENQSLKTELKNSKSQFKNSSRSPSHRSNSKQSIKSKREQQLKNKYLLRNPSNHSRSKQKPTIQNQHISSSLSSRSLSSSSHNYKSFESPKSSQPSALINKPSQLNLSSKLQSLPTSEPKVSTQRSCIQRSAPNIPLDLKRIRERNQKYFQGHNKMVNQQNSTKANYSANQQRLNKSQMVPQNISPQSQPHQSNIDTNFQSPIKLISNNPILICDDESPIHQSLKQHIIS